MVLFIWQQFFTESELFMYVLAKCVEESGDKS